jgi:hypothetical protein
MKYSRWAPPALKGGEEEDKKAVCGDHLCGLSLKLRSRDRSWGGFVHLMEKRGNSGGSSI